MTGTIIASSRVSDLTIGMDGAPSRTVYLYQNGSGDNPPASPGTGPTDGFTTDGQAVAIGSWMTTSSAPASGQAIFVASRNIRQPGGEGDWVEDGAWQVNFAGGAGTTGAQGADAPRFAEIILYTNPVVATAPPPPTAIINWTTGEVTTPTGWSRTPPTVTASSNLSVFSSVVIFIDTTPPFTTTSATGSTPVQATNFSGLVTFTGGDFAVDGAAITNIDGGNIATNTITATQINAAGLTVEAANVTGRLTVGQLPGLSELRSASLGNGDESIRVSRPTGGTSTSRALTLTFSGVATGTRLLVFGTVEASSFGGDDGTGSITATQTGLRTTASGNDPAETWSENIAGAAGGRVGQVFTTRFSGVGVSTGTSVTLTMTVTGTTDRNLAIRRMRLIALAVEA